MIATIASQCYGTGIIVHVTSYIAYYACKQINRMTLFYNYYHYTYLYTSYTLFS